MNQNTDIMNRLGLLRNGIREKDALGKEYIRKVKDFLQKIRQYLNNLNQDSGAVARLTKEKADLTRELEQLRAEHANALKQVTDRNAELENSLKACNEELDRLKQTLKDGAAQSEASKKAVAAMQQQLDAANRALAQSRAALDALQEQLRGIYDTFDELLRLLDAASINRDDIAGLDALIAELNGLLQPGGGPPGGSGAGGRGAGGFPIGQRGKFTQLRGAAKAAGGEDKSSIEMSDIYPERKDPQGQLSAAERAALNRFGNKGGKTKRRRHKKTMHRGGYVEKLKAKKTRKRPRTSKRRKSTASSSSASSNSRQKSVQGRKM